MFDDDELDDIREQRAEWEENTLDPTLEAHGERKEQFATVSNHEVDRLYTPEDIADLDFDKDLGFPVNRRTGGVHTRQCTADGRGRYVNSPDSALPRRPTSAFTTSSTRARPGSRRRSTCPR